MKISELLLEDESSSIDQQTKLMAALYQIAGRIEDTDADTPVSLKSVLGMLSELGINLSRDQFTSMVSQEPLNNIIANVQGDNVVFLGQSTESSGAMKPDQDTATLEKMAKRAGNLRK